MGAIIGQMMNNRRNLDAIIRDASQKQSAAADPLTSAWVSASAGTGKTRVLTNRFLRLLLLGEAPESLLALTFTNAAAAEMANRVTDELEKWAQSDDDLLSEKLNKLLGRQASKDEFYRARLLFTQSLGLPQGFSIQTIHSFCGSLLKRFPIEAGLAPDGKPIDEHTASALLSEVIGSIATDVPRDDPVRQAIERMLIHLTPETLVGLMANAVRERANIKESLDAHNGIEGVLHALARAWGIAPNFVDDNNGDDKLCESFWQPNNSVKQGLTQLRDALENNDTQSGKSIHTALSQLLAGETQDFDDYMSAFLTKETQPRKATIKKIKNCEILSELFHGEAQRVRACVEQRRALKLIQLNRDFLTLTQRVIHDLTQKKRARNILDFDDIILLTARLLTSDSHAAQWVQYKLDQGIRHLMVDEAQDTNPDQWRVIYALEQEFFAGKGTASPSGLERTLFVVGDLKQSIFSFQRANPELFECARQDFKKAAIEAQRPWLDQPLTTTFRCAPAILDAVNAVFGQPGMAEGLNFGKEDDWPEHQSARRQDRGEVVLYPPFIKPTAANNDSWDNLPAASELESTFDSMNIVAQEIANKIAHWTAALSNADKELDQSQWLSAPNGSIRRVRPGDVLILLRKRGPYVDKLITCLRKRGIPVAGSDRLNLLDQLAIKDLLVLADASLQPADDLSVATILRSPLAPIDDLTLENIAWSRKKQKPSLSLAQNLDIAASQKDVDPNIQQANSFIKHCQSLAVTLPAYEFFAAVLYGQIAYHTTASERMLARLGSEILDPIHELLAQARNFEGDSPPTLQKFLVWIRRRDGKIKRDLEAEKNEKEEGIESAGTSQMGQVRIMTAHASKGLEAPIVILGDAFQETTEHFNQRFIWQASVSNKSDKIRLPVWSPTQKDDTELIEQLKENIKHTQALEERRLLYVAMTRAEERLHIFGLCNDKNNSRQTGWYSTIESGLANLVNAKETEISSLPDTYQWAGPSYCWQTGEALTHAQIPASTSPTDSSFPEFSFSPLPSWAKTSPKPEPSPPRPLSPSRLDSEAEEEHALLSQSPLDPLMKKRFLRGTLTHSLFHHLVELPKNQQRPAGFKLLDKPGYNLGLETIEEILSQVLNILHDSRYQNLFGPNSRAEVPISGLVDSVPISGQVDRLVEQKDPQGHVVEVHVVDFKTNRLAPKSVPYRYQLQMSAYARVLQQIYPAAQIRPYLLWTNTSVLMEVENWNDIALPGSLLSTPNQLTLL